MSNCAGLHTALLAFASVLAIAGGALASCQAPERPYLPADAVDVRAYADLIREDFEGYIVEVQTYFRCLDTERARAFAEAQDVSQDYGRFQGLVQE